MPKKNVTAMTLVDIENGQSIHEVLMNRPAKPAKVKGTKKPVPMQTFALESLPLEDVTSGLRERTPDEMFERVTAGLIHLDNEKRMEAIHSSSRIWLVLGMLVLAIIGLIVILAIQFI